MKSNKKTRTDKSEVALQPTDPIHPVRLGAHSINLSTGVGHQLCSRREVLALPYSLLSIKHIII